jgi:integrase/recombinase XerD
MPAKTITDAQLNVVLAHVADHSSDPLRDYVILMLSFRAGLRVSEIAGLRWADVCDAEGNLRRDILEVPKAISKYCSGRTIPMHKAVHAALKAYLSHLQDKRSVAMNETIIHSLYGEQRKMSGNALQRYIGRLFQAVGYSGCSSHSGRRTFITKAMRKAPQAGCSIRDVQKLAGHRYMSTTELYVDPSEEQQALVDMI